MSSTDQYKQQAAERALDYVQSGMALGLGSGSTARFMVLGLGERLRDGRLHDIIGVPTSEATASLARQLGISLATLDERPELDVALDGADEIDPQLNLIKGLGGALLREKIIESSAHKLIIFADASKLVNQLGEHTPVPVEVIAFGKALCTRRLTELGCKPVVRVTADGKPYLTDEGNIILDCHFPSIPDPAVLNVAIKAIPGVVDHGLFLNMASVALVAGPTGMMVIERPA